MVSASSIGTPSQWCLLSADLLDSIEEETKNYVDKVRLRCICASWRSQLPKLHSHPIGSRLPWLLVPFNDNKGASKFYDPVEKKLYELDYLPEVEETALFKGSALGGCVVVAETKDEIYVVNPLTRARFQLPPRSKFPDVRKYRADKRDNEYFIRCPRNSGDYYMDATHLRNHLLQKIVLSSSTCDTDFIAAAIYGEVGRLAYCRRGDKKWSVLTDDYGQSDVKFCERVLYAVRRNGRVVAFDFNNNINGSRPNLKVIEIAEGFPKSLVGLLYLVWCSGEMIMVRRYSDLDQEDDDDVAISITLRFDIFKLDNTSNVRKARKWCKVKSIGDNVLFLGLNTSTAFSCRDFPGCFKRNQIYFSDDYIFPESKGSGKQFDQGVYSLDEKVFERFPTCVGDTREVWPAPIWIMPK